MQFKELLREKCPNIPALRRLVSKTRIRTLKRRMLPADEIVMGENDFEVRKQIVEKYSQKWSKYYAKTLQKIEHLFLNASEYRNRTDKDILRINLLFYRYAYGFLPEEYLCFRLEEKSSNEIKEFVSDIERIIFDCQMSDMADSVVFKDKAHTYKQFDKYYKRDAISVECNRDYKKFETFITKHPKFVKKEVFESLGRGTELVDVSKLTISTNMYFEHLIRKGKHILEEVVIQSDAMRVFNESSVNTVRCITFNTRSGIKIPYCFMKSGRKGSFVDNGGAGGILVGIDCDTGQLMTDGIDEFGETYASHPDSGIVFKGYQLPDWASMINICTELSKQVPTVGFIGWDMAHTDEGWVIIEGNNCGQMIVPQMTWQKGIKKEVLELMSDMNLMVQKISI